MYFARLINMKNAWKGERVLQSWYTNSKFQRDYLRNDMTLGDIWMNVVPRTGSIWHFPEAEVYCKTPPIFGPTYQNWKKKYLHWRSLFWGILWDSPPTNGQLYLYTIIWKNPSRKSLLGGHFTKQPPYTDQYTSILTLETTLLQFHFRGAFCEKPPLKCISLPAN